MRELTVKATLVAQLFKSLFFFFLVFPDFPPSKSTGNRRTTQRLRQLQPLKKKVLHFFNVRDTTRKFIAQSHCVVNSGHRSVCVGLTEVAEKNAMQRKENVISARVRPQPSCVHPWRQCTCADMHSTVTWYFRLGLSTVIWSRISTG